MHTFDKITASYIRKRWLSLQYKSLMSIMEGFNFLQNCYNHPIDYSYLLPFHSYYHLWQPITFGAPSHFQNLQNIFPQAQPLICQNKDVLTPLMEVQESRLLEKASKNQKQPISSNSRVRKSRSHPDGQSFNSTQPKQLKNASEQKENRNVYSNILRNFFRRVNDFAKIEPLVRKILIFHQLNVTIQGFMDFVKRLKVNHAKYLRFKKLRPLFIDNLMPEYALIFRVLMEIFRKGDLVVQTLTSRKIGKWSVTLHLKGSRQIKDKLYR